MLTDLNQRLSEVKEAQRRQRKLQAHLAGARRSLEQECARLAACETELLKEGKDVERLEGLSLAGLFYTILGSQEEQLEKERQERLAAKLRYDKSRYAVQALEDEVADLQRQLGRLGDVEAQYKAVLAEKESRLRQGGAAPGRRLIELDEQIAQAQAEHTELVEAIEAGNLARQGLGRVMDALQSAGNWGVWDMLGGGLLATAAKHSRIDDARQAAYEVEPALRRFQRELADVGGQAGAAQVEVSAFETFADFFLDGLIFDWVVQSRINQSLENTLKLYDRTGKILTDLSKSQAASAQRVGALKEERQALLEQSS